MPPLPQCISPCSEHGPCLSLDFATPFSSLHSRLPGTWAFPQSDFPPNYCLVSTYKGITVSSMLCDKLLRIHTLTLIINIWVHLLFSAHSHRCCHLFNDFSLLTLSCRSKKDFGRLKASMLQMLLEAHPSIYHDSRVFNYWFLMWWCSSTPFWSHGCNPLSFCLFFLWLEDTPTSGCSSVWNFHRLKPPSPSTFPSGDGCALSD